VNASIAQQNILANNSWQTKNTYLMIINYVCQGK